MAATNMAEQSGPQSRQSYPSPQMQSAYAYPTPGPGQPSEPYRQSPTASSTQLPPMNLPPLRSIEGQAQQAAPPAAQHGGSPVQAVQQMSAYYPPPPQGLQQGVTSSPHMMRYVAAIPQGDQRMMSGGRHKKEIKRRTKTGCLTCRKRRIKCDEQHPACRNCQKSKRECLGYDPIFKQQQGPQSLQPAPSASPTSTPSTPAAPSTIPSGYRPPQPPFTPPVPYSSAPSSTAPPSTSYTNHGPFEYGSAIDPALAGAESGRSNHPPAYGNRKPPINNSTHLPANVKMERKPARPLNVNELFYIDNYGPYEVPPNPAPISSAKMEEIRSLYINDFAPGLDGLVETTWYSTVGLDRLSGNTALCQQMAELIKYFTQVPGRNDYEAETRCRATETKAVWLLLAMCRPSANNTNGINGSTSMNVDLDEVNKRLDILEHLLTNRILATNHVTQIRYPVDVPVEKHHEIDFWKSLGRFVTLRSEDHNARPELDVALAQCRNLLGGRENRDVIYSIMVGRHVGARVPEFPNHVHPGPGGEENDHNKLVIAKTFITEQAAFKGTNHPIQRVCDMVIRSWALR